MNSPTKFVSAVAGIVAAFGCSDLDSFRSTPAPTLANYSAAEIAVGDSVIFTGENFSRDTRIILTGDFVPENGGLFVVTKEIHPHFIDSQTLRWDPVGPYRVPFGTGDQLGEFTGHAYAISAGHGSDRAQIPLRFVFQPSLIVSRFEPLDSSCEKSAPRVLEDTAYRIVAETIGLRAESIEVTLSSVYGEQTVEAPNSVTGAILGRYGEIRFDQVPEDLRARYV